MFKDVEEGRWSKADIDALVALGLMGGFPDGTFRPGEPLTREQFASAFHRGLKAQLNVLSLNSTQQAQAAMRKVVAIGDGVSVQGAGVIVDSKGRVLTCSHVLSGLSYIVASFEKGREDKKLAMRVVKDWPLDDLALIEPFFPIRFNPEFAVWREEIPRPGEWVFACGAPLADEDAISWGVVASLDHDLKYDEKYGPQDCIRITAPINPGNSGGGLFDVRGNCLGITNAKIVNVSVEGFGFAIPAKTVIERLREVA